MRKLRFAQISTIWESTPPGLYGGTERVASALTEELVRRGHTVTLFATGDSKTAANLKSVVAKPLYRQGIPWGNISYPLLHLYNAFQSADDFDLIHVHLNLEADYMALGFTDLIKCPAIFTIHFNLPDAHGPKPDQYLVLDMFSHLNFVSISNFQRKIKSLNYVATVYNGVPIEKLKFYPSGGSDLVWLGRFTHDKGTKEAIEVALELNTPIKLAGKLDQQDKNVQNYYHAEIEPLIKSNPKSISYVGEVGDQDKSVFLGSAKCLVNPINWDEPFGLVVPEANSCGTPVVAFDRGAMPEIIQDGVNGYLVPPGDVKEMARVVKKIFDMPKDEYEKLRLTSRQWVENRFSIEKMVDGYEAVYSEVAGK